MTENVYHPVLDALRADGFSDLGDIALVTENWGTKNANIRKRLSSALNLESEEARKWYRFVALVLLPGVMILSTGYAFLGWLLAPTYWVPAICIFFGALALYVGMKMIDDFIADGYIWTLCPQKTIRTGNDLSDEKLRSKYQTMVDSLTKQFPDLAIQEADARFWSDLRSYLVLSGPTWSIVLK